MTNVTLWWGTLITEEAVHVGGPGEYGKALGFLLNFPVTLKLL